MKKELRPGEIVNILKKEIQAVDINQVEKEDQGEIIEIFDGIARVGGLRGVMFNEMVEFENGFTGIAFNLEVDNVGVLLLDPVHDLKEGMKLKRTRKLSSVPVGDGILGRVIDPLGRALDGQSSLDYFEERRIDVKAPGIMSRQEVRDPMQTGIKVIDSVVPIGRGQRELIIGDRQTGKTTIAIDTIINQKGQNVKCIYVAIGQKQSTVSALVNRLKEYGAMEYTSVVVAPIVAPAPILYYAPYSATTMAEYFLDKGDDVLIVYDDLTKHAQSYRELSLLLKRPPGREAFPGDVFYLHSRLLERSVKLSDKLGGGSITSLPIVETQAGDVSAYIPTNVISITDGQIFLDTELFNSGQRPAMDIGISVSRVGSAAQIKSMKQAVGSLKPDLQQYLEIKAFSQFASDLDAETKKQLNHGIKLMSLMKQKNYEPLNVIDQILILFSGTRGYVDRVPLDKIEEYQEELISHMKINHKILYDDIVENKSISKKNEVELKEIIDKFTQRFEE